MKPNVFRTLLLALPAAGLVAFLMFRPSGLMSQLAHLSLAGLGGSSAYTGHGCDPAHPSFLYGFAALKEQLGPVMGDPLECEHSIHVNGDARQLTTTGYAYYRTSANIPAFTSGADRWALTQNGLVHWSGDVVDPPY